MRGRCAEGRFATVGIKAWMKVTRRGRSSTTQSTFRAAGTFPVLKSLDETGSMVFSVRSQIHVSCPFLLLMNTSFIRKERGKVSPVVLKELKKGTNGIAMRLTA